MRKFYCFIPLLLFMLNGFAQKKRTARPKKEEEIFTCYYPMEISAQFPGGEAAWLQYINHKNRLDSVYESLDGEVNPWAITVSFVITDKGKVEVMGMANDSAVHPGFKAELRRLFESSPKWIPGTQLERPVKNYRSQKINFVFTEEKTGAKKPDGSE